MRKNIICKICKGCEKQFTTLNNRKMFCTRACGTKHYHPKRVERTCTYTCEKCQKQFSTVYAIRKERHKHCDNCKRMVSNPKSLKNLISIKSVSKRTGTKILQRLKIGCSACGWNECNCDLHHIIPKSKGGSDKHSNLTYVCPNCHRKLHDGIKVKYKTFEQQVGNTWKKYYNVDKNCRSI